MRNIKVMMSYCGTKYHGFQRQENAITVQEIVENSLLKILDGKTTIYGCSRTDTGVHANEYCFNFRTEKPISMIGIQRGLNTILPDDISVFSAEEVDDSFHARYSCVAKEYIYKIHNAESKNPFMTNLAFHYRRPLDEKLLDTVGKAFVGTHDFKTFCSAGSNKDITVRTIERFSVIRNNNEVDILVKGDGFLYNMVRIMVGTLLNINEGRIPSEMLTEIIQAKDRKMAGKTAQPQGLYLNKVYY
ncbi:MAG: tRNA pseudouridine(38-40) synthase TruA [Oscillospiraceae bacterium]